MFFILSFLFLFFTQCRAYDESMALRYVGVAGATYCDEASINQKTSFHFDDLAEVEIGSVWSNSSLLFYTAYDG